MRNENIICFAIMVLNRIITMTKSAILLINHKKIWTIIERNIRKKLNVYAARPN